MVDFKSLKQYATYALPLISAAVVMVSVLSAPLIGNKSADAASWKTLAQCEKEAKNSNDDTYASRCINNESIEGAVYRVYRVVLGRQPDRSGFNYWVGKAQVAANQGKSPVSTVVTGLMASNEYRNKIMTGNNKLFIEETYVRAFGKKADAAGVKYWESRINSRAISHAQFLEHFAQIDRTKLTWSIEAPCYVTSYLRYCAG